MSVTQGIGNRGTSVSAVPYKDGYDLGSSLVYNDDMGRTVGRISYSGLTSFKSPADPKLTFSLAPTPPNYAQKIEPIYSEPNSTTYLTGLNFKETPDKQYARPWGDYWMKGLAEVTDFNAGGNANLKYYNSYNLQGMAGNFPTYQAKFTVAVRWIPPLGSNDSVVEHSQTYDLEFTGKLQASADVMPISFTARPASNWRGGLSGISENIPYDVDALTLTEPSTKYWIRQYA